MSPRPAAITVGDVLTLTKVRVNLLVIATTAGGYVMGSHGAVDRLAMVGVCAATYLVASGAATLNQVFERDVDRLMLRTRDRPLAAERMDVRDGLMIGFGLAVVGLLVLWQAFGTPAALVAAATFGLYVWVYTPLKRITSLSTIVGGVPGALPPLIGWAAAHASLATPSAWALFLMGFVWQMPHILAVGWMYRDDYARAHLPVPAVVDATGAMSGRQAVVWSAAMIPISLLPSALHLTGLLYAIGVLTLGVAQFALTVVFARDRSTANARRLFYATLTYLPLLWLFMIATRRG